jgi:hypothetical protein
MKLFMLIGLCIAAGVLLPASQLKAQSNSHDSVFYAAAVSNAIAVYRQSSLDQSRLYNGRKYKPYGISFINGVPFFMTDQFSEGSIIYEGGFYDKVRLLYDEVKERVIVRTDVAIELINERIETFSISGHTFVRLNADSLHKNISTGFYEKLYTGKIEVYKKERKLIKENLSTTEGVRGDIELKIVYYLKKDGVYYPVKKKSHINEILSDHQNEIQKFIKNKGLSFRNDSDNTLIQIAGYYDQLTR